MYLFLDILCRVLGVETYNNSYPSIFILRAGIGSVLGIGRYLRFRDRDRYREGNSGIGTSLLIRMVQELIQSNYELNHIH